MSSPSVGMLLLIAVQGAASPQPAYKSASALPPVTVLQIPRQDAGPYAKVFVQPEESEARVQLRETLKPQGGRQNVPPKIVCGMVVFQADPNVDAGMVIQRRSGSTVVPHIRRIPPPACED